MSQKRFFRSYVTSKILRPYLEKKRTRIRTPIPVEVQVGSFLYYISDEGCCRNTAKYFRNF